MTLLLCAFWDLLTPENEGSAFLLNIRNHLHNTASYSCRPQSSWHITIDCSFHKYGSFHDEEALKYSGWLGVATLCLSSQN